MRQSSVFSKILLLGVGMFILTFLILENKASYGSNQNAKLSYFHQLSLKSYQYFNRTNIDKIQSYVNLDVFKFETMNQLSNDTRHDFGHEVSSLDNSTAGLDKGVRYIVINLCKSLLCGQIVKIKVWRL